MKKFRIYILVLLFITVRLISTPAKAVCDGDFSTLISAINNATYENAKDRTGLLGKANEAWYKANKGKTGDAITKLNQIITKTNTLVTTGKITSGGNAIISSASTVIACLQ